jgi:hypothetical protein
MADSKDSKSAAVVEKSDSTAHLFQALSPEGDMWVSTDGKLDQIVKEQKVGKMILRANVRIESKDGQVQPVLHEDELMMGVTVSFQLLHRSAPWPKILAWTDITPTFQAYVLRKLPGSLEAMNRVIFMGDHDELKMDVLSMPLPSPESPLKPSAFAGAVDYVYLDLSNPKLTDEIRSRIGDRLNLQNNALVCRIPRPLDTKLAPSASASH